MSRSTGFYSNKNYPVQNHNIPSSNEKHYNNTTKPLEATNQNIQ